MGNWLSIFYLKLMPMIFQVGISFLFLLYFDVTILIDLLTIIKKQKHMIKINITFL